MKRNVWIQWERPFAVWTAEVPTSDALVRIILAAGAKHRVLLAHELFAPAAAVMAWYDAEGRVAEGEIADLALVLADVSPGADVLGDIFRERFPPVRLVHSRRGFYVELHSDIWWPFVFGVAHPRANRTHYFDNRELAARHTPRLNAFLGDVAAAVTAAGGRWSVDRDETGTDSGRWVGEAGIALDGPAPPLFPEDAWNDEWF